MEYCVRTVLAHKTHSLRYADDTFVMWSHGKDSLDAFLLCLNGFHKKHPNHYGGGRSERLSFLDLLVS